jgi:hypothetical protein
MHINALRDPGYQQQPEFTQEVIERCRRLLRFDLNDRVLCYCGPRWFSGHVVGTAVVEDDGLVAYLVKTDVLPGVRSTSISVPRDKDEICVQEVCFDPVAQLHMVRCAAPVVTESSKPKLRFAVGEKVVCRIRNDPSDGLENWVPGCISEIWPTLEEGTWELGDVSGKFPDMLPYKIDLASGKWLYCHRDVHTLIRREGHQPATRVKGVSKRIEVRREADGSMVRIDHVTERKKRMLEAVDSSDDTD